MIIGEGCVDGWESVIGYQGRETDNTLSVDVW